MSPKVAWILSIIFAIVGGFLLAQDMEVFYYTRSLISLAWIIVWGVITYVNVQTAVRGFRYFGR